MPGNGNGAMHGGDDGAIPGPRMVTEQLDSAPKQLPAHKLRKKIAKIIYYS